MGTQVGAGGKVCVIGAGYIGLPTSALLADAGYDVIATDTNQKIVESINRGESHVSEPGVPELVKKVVASGKLKATTNVISACKESDVMIIIVPTPMKGKEPDLSFIAKAAEFVSQGLERGNLVILESTVYPGTTENFLAPILEKSGLKAGKDFYLAYSPERAMPTRTLHEMRTNARVIGGITKECAEKAKKLYSRITSGEITIVDGPTKAELIKLVENVYRDVNIALANELALFCEKLGINVHEIISVANKHPRVHIHVPGSGVGGHCIPKDPYFIINKARELGFSARLLESARTINEEMPEHMIKLIKEGFGELGQSVAGKRVSVLGLAYKGDTDDTRGTPSEYLIKRLKELGAKVVVEDPYVKQKEFRQVSLQEALRSDCLAIMTNHSEYHKINLSELSKNGLKLIVDGRNVFNKEEVTNSGILYKGVGNL